MKTRRVAFVGLCIAMLIAVGAYGDKTEGQGKPGKPPSTSKECIVFTGHLEGRQVVEGCCPNRGPFPGYEMNLSPGILDGFEGPYDGHLFVNRYRPGRLQHYMVEFWTDNPEDNLHFVVIGGVVGEGTTKTTLVMNFTPDNSICEDPETHAECHPTFTLVRTSDVDPCPGP